jgi:hypothetical protein
MRGPSIFHSYYMMPKETAEAKDEVSGSYTLHAKAYLQMPKETAEAKDEVSGFFGNLQ